MDNNEAIELMNGINDLQIQQNDQLNKAEKIAEKIDITADKVNLIANGVEKKVQAELDGGIENVKSAFTILNRNLHSINLPNVERIVQQAADRVVKEHTNWQNIAQNIAGNASELKVIKTSLDRKQYAISFLFGFLACAIISMFSAFQWGKDFFYKWGKEQVDALQNYMLGADKLKKFIINNKIEVEAGKYCTDQNIAYQRL